MPYRWEQTDRETITLQLWPFRSLTRQGQVVFVAITAAMLALPLLAVVGSPALWGLLPFVVVVVWAMMLALDRSFRSGRTREVLTVTTDRVRLLRRDPGRPDRSWQANPYWMRVSLREDGPVEDYLTLTGGLNEDGRTVELGAFLSPGERIALAGELREVLANIRHPASPGPG